jgi:HNH endonuclease
MPFEVEHIIPLKHRGETAAANLALACFYCNRYKGPNVAGIAGPGGAVVRLFHPRLDAWGDHFAWDGPLLLARTDIGAVTIEVLRINLPNAMAVREVLMNEGLW